MCRRKGQPLVALLMADSRHSLWDDTGQRHLLFRHSEGRRSGMYLLPSAVNLIYAMQQGYDFVHFQVSSFSAAAGLPSALQPPHIWKAVRLLPQRKDWPSAMSTVPSIATGVAQYILA